jgi:hypothetical protein
LEKRDLEIAQIAEGKIQRTKKYKISSKVRKEGFNEYMKIYLKEPKKGVRFHLIKPSFLHLFDI